MLKGLIILNTSRFEYEGLKNCVMHIRRSEGFMGTHTTHRHTTLHYIFALIVTCFRALFVWYAGWLLSMSTMEMGVRENSQNLRERVLKKANEMKRSQPI